MMAAPVRAEPGRRVTRRPILAAVDPWLAIALVLATAFCLHGITWGRYESWHPDQLVMFRFDGTDAPLLPRDFLKPPFYTYINFLVVELPAKVIAHLFGLSPGVYNQIFMIGSGLLATCFLLGSIVIIYALLRPTFGSAIARISAFLFATSAGFVTYVHFLTADIPVTFWMLAAFMAAVRILHGPTLRAYLACGLLIGLATATKYNGLSIGVAFAAAHFIVWRQSGGPLAGVLLDRRFLVGLVGVGLGFVLANPYAVLRAKKFLVDFWIVYVTTPIYDGTTSGNSYLRFLDSTSEIFGIPLALLLGVALVYALCWLLGGRSWSSQQRLIAIALVTIAVYFVKMGAFPRFETRFALPVLPLALLCAAPLWQRLGQRRTLILTVPLMLYGGAASAYIGRALLDDPRMDAQRWFARNAPTDATVEITAFSPFYHRIPGVRIERVWMPWISTRRRLLPDLFLDQPTLRERWYQIEPPEDLHWYSAAGLSERQPAMIGLDSLYYNRFTSEPGRSLYPGIAMYFRDLICERLGYKIVFDQKSGPLPWWLYPRRIDFLENRAIILARAPSTTGSPPAPAEGACDLPQGYYAFNALPGLRAVGPARARAGPGIAGVASAMP